MNACPLCLKSLHQCNFGLFHVMFGTNPTSGEVTGSTSNLGFGPVFPSCEVVLTSTSPVEIGAISARATFILALVFLHVAALVTIGCLSDF